jgi:hypothetical protein
MPGGDRTGPQGEGSRTGRGLGYCADYDQPGYATPQQGQRFGFRRGGRGNRGSRGWRNRSNAGFWPGRGRGGFAFIPDAPDQDIDSLKEQISELQNTLKEVQNRLDQFEK